MREPWAKARAIHSLDDVESQADLVGDAVLPTDGERARLAVAIAAADRAGPDDWIPASRVIRR